MHQHHFIRIQFSDDNQQVPFYNDKTKPLLEYVRSLMQDGVTVGNRTLRFIGYSNSQLKMRQCYFICVDDPQFKLHNNGQELLEAQGNFNAIANLLLRNARIGQLFSTTKTICTLAEDELIIGGLEEIERNDFNFTDGIGSISPELAFQAAHEYKRHYASGFQVRIGGAKGVLMVDTRLEGRQIRLRDS